MIRPRVLAFALLLALLAVPAVVVAQSRGVNDVEVLRFVLPSRAHPNQTGFRVHASGSRMNLTIFTALKFTGVYFADLPALLLGNGVMVYCIDCNPAATCGGGGGSGAFAKRIGGAWVCN